MEALAAGAVIGLSVAAPPGPNAMVCISRTLAGGRSAGFRCGLGAASAHAVYATVAVLGAGRASGVLAAGHDAIGVVGGLVLVGLGVRLGLAPTSRAVPPSPTRAYALTLLVGLANPLTLLYFAAAVTLGAARTMAARRWSPACSSARRCGTLPASGVAALGSRLDARWLAVAGRVAAGAIVGFGVLAVVTAL